MNNYQLSIPNTLVNLSELIKTTRIEKGRHYQSLYILEFSNSVKYVLKVKNAAESGSLLREAERLEWAHKAILTPRVIGYQVENGKEYIFPNHTMEQLIDFLEQNKASADELVFTHGDYGSGNVMINDGRIEAFIDLGDSGISDPYYDIYYLFKSLTYYTDRKEEFGEFMKGYGISELNESRMKFHLIIDTLLL